MEKTCVAHKNMQGYEKPENLKGRQVQPLDFRLVVYSTVTDLAKFRGLSTSSPLAQAA